MNYNSVQLQEEEVEINNHTEIRVFCIQMAAMKDKRLTFLIKIFLLTVISPPGKMEGR